VARPERYEGRGASVREPELTGFVAASFVMSVFDHGPRGLDSERLGADARAAQAGDAGARRRLAIGRFAVIVPIGPVVGEQVPRPRPRGFRRRSHAAARARSPGRPPPRLSLAADLVATVRMWVGAYVRESPAWGEIRKELELEGVAGAR
jgi:hypothetical protein